MGKKPSSHIIHSLGGEYCWIVRDSEPIRLLKSPRSLSVYILNLDIFCLLACSLIGFFEVTWHLTMTLFPANSAVLGLSEEMGMSKSKRWWDGKILLFFPSLSVFLLCLTFLDNQIKYHENHRERLRTRQVNCIMMMKSSNIFNGRHLNRRWRNTSSVQNHY